MVLRILLIVAGLALLAWVGLVAYSRLAVIEADRWHVDPVKAPDPAISGHRSLPGPDSPRYAGPPDKVMAAVVRAAEAERLVSVLAGDTASAWITFAFRSRVFGFVDVMSVRAVEMDGGVQLAVYARSHIGGCDYGVNEARVERILARLADDPTVLPQP